MSTFIMRAINNRNAYQESLHEPFHDVVAGLVCKYIENGRIGLI